MAPQPPAILASVSIPSLVLTGLAVLVSILALIVQKRNLEIQSQNQKRQRRLEAFRAVHDFNEAYNKIVEFIPDDFKVACQESQDSNGSASFILEKLVPDQSDKSQGDQPELFLEAESFFRRYWMLQKAQYDSWKEGFLPDDIYRVWMRSNMLVYHNGSYWITADSYRHGYEQSKRLFVSSAKWSPPPWSTSNDGLASTSIDGFVNFIDTLFAENDQEEEPRIDFVELDSKSLAMAQDAKSIELNYFDDEIRY
jgi:type II secretory pathway pseudopilin PulG